MRSGGAIGVGMEEKDMSPEFSKETAYITKHVSLYFLLGNGLVCSLEINYRSVYERLYL